ncbi:MAG: TIGR01244 family sulfur transferase [Limnobacter sp.]|uniref:TIGR01244 family sulfur transferase n=1 Tax=Limnobacter sp. TaxID=2003368 RepID=UPI00391B9EBF
MSLRKLSDDVAVCGQIRPEDMKQVRELGFKTVINNRPDFEEPGQPLHAEIEASATAEGLAVHYLPLAAGMYPSQELLDQFKAVFDAAEKPVLAFCRSGNRSGQIYMGACGQAQ